MHKMMYPYPRPIMFKIEKIIGFIIFVIGIFAILKFLNILNETLIVPNEYLGWFTAGACIFFGFILMSNNQHGLH